MAKVEVNYILIFSTDFTDTLPELLAWINKEFPAFDDKEKPWHICYRGMFVVPGVNEHTMISDKKRAPAAMHQNFTWYFPSTEPFAALKTVSLRQVKYFKAMWPELIVELIPQPYYMVDEDDNDNDGAYDIIIDDGLL